MLDALQQRGFEHETAYVNVLRKQGLSVLELPKDDSQSRAVERTIEAMREGPDVIVQATLSSGRWHGRADILRRVNTPSDLGDWSYEVVDAKLARETRGGTILQLCVYSEIVRTIQGRLPEQMYVITTGTDYIPKAYRTLDYMAFYRRVRSRLESAVADLNAEIST
ncbi:MAG: TM0106 family RecB-like putative nuclease, partial [Gammaproteobacteria bacterium]